MNNEEIKAIEDFKAQEKQKIEEVCAKIEDEDLREQVKSDRLEFLNNYEYIKLDDSKKTVIAGCRHEWEQDSPNHKICKRCKYGRFI